MNVEGQAAQEASSDEEQPDDAYARQIVPFPYERGLPERSSSIRANAISTSSSRTIGPSAMASGVGRIGFQWSGVERVSRRQQRVAGLARPTGNGRTAAPFCLGSWRAVPGQSPRGASLLSLPRHSVFRIHGTNQPETIGHAVSSGCCRLDTADVIDLYDRVQVGVQKVRSGNVGPRVSLDANKGFEGRGSVQRGIPLRPNALASGPTGHQKGTLGARPAPRPSASWLVEARADQRIR